MKPGLVFAAVLAASALAGAAGGLGLRLLAAPEPSDRSGEAAAPEASEPRSDAPAAARPHDAPTKDEAAQKKKKKAHGEDHGEAREAADFFKFSRQFVAPIVRGGRPEAMIVLDVVIELAPGAGDGLYGIEPRLRDAVMKALIAQSGRGELQELLDDPSRLEATRAAVFAGVQDVIGDKARAVLLLDVAYQPF